MKSIIALSFFVAISSVHAMPIASQEAIRGLISTPAFDTVEQQVLANLKSYDGLSIQSVDTSDKTMMARCHPTGSVSKSGTNLKVVFSSSWNQTSETHYFETSYRAEDLRHCTP